MLRALNHRQHEGGRHGLNLQLKACIIWCIRHLPVLPARPVPINMEKRRVMISYSDGERSYARVVIALWAQGQKMARAGVVRIPGDLRTHWNRKRKGNWYNDIDEVEAVGLLLALTNFGEDLVVCLWLHFVDNSGALSSLIRGGSSVESGDYITYITWSHIVGVGCMPWFDRVDSASNSTDDLSWERLQGPWTLEGSVGRAHGGPCFKPSCAYPWRRVIRRLTPQRGLLPSTHAGGRLRRRQPVRASHLILRPSSKVEVLLPTVGEADHLAWWRVLPCLSQELRRGSPPLSVQNEEDHCVSI